MELIDRETGERLAVRFRPLVRADVPGAIACIRDAYGDTYVKPYLYTEEGLWAHHQSGSLSFSVAETASGELAGIIANEVSPFFPGRTEIACQVVPRRWSGLGLALPLAIYQMERAEAGGFRSQFARALGCHLISQKTLDGMGFSHCGFLLSVFDRTRLTTRYRTDGNRKIPQSVAVKAQAAARPAALWVPERLLPLAARLYRDLVLPWTLLEPGGAPDGEGLWDYEQDQRHATLLLASRRPGGDFVPVLRRVLSEGRENPLQTVNLLLNLSCPGSAGAFRAAEELGFFFTGFLPCGEDGEYAILHHPMAVGVDMDHIPYIPAYEPYAAEIRRQLHER